MKQRAGRALDRELGRSSLWRVARWGTASWATASEERAGESGPTLAHDLSRAIRTPDASTRAALLERLSRQPLLVTRWLAVPEVRAKISALRVMPEGQVLSEQVFPILRHFALRLAWEDVSPRPEMDLYRVAHDLHSRAMAHLTNFLDEIAEDPDSAAGVARSAQRRDREYLLAGVLDLRRALGPGWRRRRAVMLGSTPGALRTRLWRLKKKRDATRCGTPAKSKT